MEVKFSKVDIYGKLLERYRKYLRPEITSVYLIQDEEEVIMEITELEVTEDGLEIEKVSRMDLGFIVDDPEDEEFYFNPKDSIEVNARKIIYDYDLYSIVMTTDLFHKEACENIEKKVNIFVLINNV